MLGDGLLSTIVEMVVVFFMVFGGPLAYVFQYDKIRKGDGKGFSTFVSMVLLVCNIVRCAFWYGNRFELPLLFQSIVMIIAQLAMMHAWCENDRRERPRLSILDARSVGEVAASFWSWNTFGSYLAVAGLLVGLLATLTALLGHVALFTEALGYVALGVEAQLPMPQVIKNFRAGSTKGMSPFMVYNWLLGDSTKTILFVVRGNPPQFVFCGVLQLTLDFVVLAQMALLPGARSKKEAKE